jgi:DNA-binding response OmpR family regulator
MMDKRILVIDDESRLLATLKGYLEQENYQVRTAGNGREGLFVAREFKPDLIVLDLMMPEMDGWEFMRQHRREQNTPIIILTARVEDTDKIAGLEMGADDYLTKPFSPRELVARVRAVLRRTGAAQPETQLLRAGLLELDPDNRIARLDGRFLDLTKMEFDLLAAMMGTPGRAFSRLELLERSQGFAYDGYERTIDVHIKNLRKKIEPDSGNPQFILTVFGVGYRFNPEY